MSRCLRHRPDRQGLPQRDHHRQLHLPQPRVRADGVEYFVEPGQDDESHEDWVDARFAWWKDLGLEPRRLRLRPHSPEELAHYAKATTDIEYQFPFGWGELEGIANRTDFDLTRHAEASGTDLSYFDDAAKQHVTPYVIEPAAGVDRAALAFLSDAFTVQEVAGKPRTFLNLDPRSPRSRSPSSHSPATARRWWNWPPASPTICAPAWPVFYDASGSIGRRYARRTKPARPSP